MLLTFARRIVLIAACSVAVGQAAFADGEAKKPVLFDPDCHGCYSPMFDGVKQTYVTVHYLGLNDEDQKAQLPPSLWRGNIEQLLFAAYQHRFSKSECTKPFEGGGRTFTYGCDDQPVLLAKDGDLNETNLAAHPGTLIVAFDISINGFSSPDARTQQSDLVAAFHLTQHRPDKNLRETSFPRGFSSALSDAVIRKKLRNYVIDKIR